jgi:lipopolysaccharide/colanic/teichoic acid biosynthesis glycosyltransferase
VGSDSTETSGEIIAATSNFNLSKPHLRRLKRLIDVLVSILLIILFPIHFILNNKPVGIIKNAVQVLLKKRTWIGYIIGSKNLPGVRKGVIAVNGAYNNNAALPQESKELIDFWYAKDYDPFDDIKLILKNYKQLGS